MDRINRKPTQRETSTRTFFSAGEADAFADAMGKRVMSMTYGTDSIRVIIGPEKVENTQSGTSAKTEVAQKRAPFDMNGSIPFKPGV